MGMERKTEIIIAMPYWLIGGEIWKEKSQKENMLVQEANEFNLAVNEL